MKKILLCLLFVGFIGTINAQKSSFAEKTADLNTSVITKDMKLNKERSAHLRTALFERYSTNVEKISGKELSKEEKKAIYKVSRKKMETTLSNNFSREEILKINELLKKQNEKMMKN